MMFEKLTYSVYDLPVYKYDGVEYAIATTEEQADAAAKSAILDSLWAFSADFVVNFMRSQKILEVGSQEIDAIVKALKEMQEKLGETAGPLIRALVHSKLDEFVEEAILSDGRGHFLASYDNEEDEVSAFASKADIAEAGFSHDTYAYRVR